MNRKPVLLLTCASAWVGLSAGSAWATSDERNSCGVDPSALVCVNDRGDPAPFGTPNQHVELAEGETYQLAGRVIRRGPQYLLEIDLCAQPWLDSAQRRQDPTYRLANMPGVSWSGFLGEQVKIRVRAKLEVAYDSNYVPHVSMRLEPLSAPLSFTSKH